MISRFFIDRPIFASVIALLILLAGGISLTTLPIAQYPELVPPAVTVRAEYTGASAEMVSQTVAAPLEQALNGVDDMIYMNSLTSSDGKLELTVTFAVGVDPNQATIDVNNRVQTVLPVLPEDVRRFGVIVEEKSPTILLVVSLTSPGGIYDTTYLSNYALINVMDELKRLPGVGSAWLWGARDYAIRIWLKPDKMAQLGLTATDIAAAVRSQNMQFAAGKLSLGGIVAEEIVAVDVVQRDGVVFHAQTIDEAGLIAAQLLAEHPDGFTVAQFRDATGASRKFVLPLVSELDKRGVTRRRDDVRIAGARLPVLEL